jgi:hypothetical protein
MEDVPLALAVLCNLSDENPREQSGKSCKTISWADFTSNFLKEWRGLFSSLALKSRVKAAISQAVCTLQPQCRRSRRKAIYQWLGARERNRLADRHNPLRPSV